MSTLVHGYGQCDSTKDINTDSPAYTVYSMKYPHPFPYSLSLYTVKAA